VSSWLIPSLGLPVVMTTGRLVVLTMAGVTRHPMGVVTAAAGCAVMLMTGSAALVSLRRRRQRVSRHGSIS
jgi:hypothetical protein